MLDSVIPRKGADRKKNLQAELDAIDIKMYLENVALDAAMRLLEVLDQNKQNVSEKARAAGLALNDSDNDDSDGDLSD